MKNMEIFFSYSELFYFIWSYQIYKSNNKTIDIYD